MTIYEIRVFVFFSIGFCFNFFFPSSIDRRSFGRWCGIAIGSIWSSPDNFVCLSGWLTVARICTRRCTRSTEQTRPMMRLTLTLRQWMRAHRHWRHRRQRTTFGLLCVAACHRTHKNVDVDVVVVVVCVIEINLIIHRYFIVFRRFSRIRHFALIYNFYFHFCTDVGLRFGFYFSDFVFSSWENV